MIRSVMETMKVMSNVTNAQEVMMSRFDDRFWNYFALP